MFPYVCLSYNLSSISCVFFTYNYKENILILRYPVPIFTTDNKSDF